MERKCFQGCNGSSWSTLGGSGSTITLGSVASNTNPQRSGDVTTGFYTAGAGLVDVSLRRNLRGARA